MTDGALEPTLSPGLAGPPAWRWLLGRRETGVAGLWLLTVALVGLANPAFLAPGNLDGILVECAPTAIVACGVLLVIVTGEIDISVGSLMGLLAAVAGILTSAQAGHKALPPATAAAIVLGLGAAVGLVTGLLVTLGRVPSIIVTLGMMTALRGATSVLMGGQWVLDLPDGIRHAAVGSWLGVRISLWAALAVIAATAWLMHRTPLGRRIHAIGSSPRAAATAGLSSRRLKLFAFTVTGFLTGLATLVGALKGAAIEPDIGTGLELLVVTCVVVGGASIRGGVGTVWGAALGVLLITTIGTALTFLQAAAGGGAEMSYWERAIQGVFILLAVLTDHLTRHGRREGAP